MSIAQKTALAVRHVAFEDLGLLQPCLAARGYRTVYREAADGLDAEELAAADLMVVLGGPIGADEEALYPFLTDELRALEHRLARQRPTLGICLGAQLMARALGAPVYRGPAKELGWAPLALTAAGQQSCLAGLGTEVPVLHWHGDTFDLPDGAVRLASTALCRNQAFAPGPAALGLQFHLEPPAERIEHWLVGHAGEIAGTEGVGVADLRRATHEAAATQAIRTACLDSWLASLPG